MKNDKRWKLDENSLDIKISIMLIILLKIKAFGINVSSRKLSEKYGILSELFFRENSLQNESVEKRLRKFSKLNILEFRMKSSCSLQTLRTDEKKIPEQSYPRKWISVDEKIDTFEKWGHEIVGSETRDRKIHFSSFSWASERASKAFTPYWTLSTSSWFENEV